MLAVDSRPSSERGPEASRKYQELDKLYSTILATALDPEILEDEEIEASQLMLWTVVCAREPMTTQVLASLLNLTEQRVSSVLLPLRSVLHMSEKDGVVSTLHASFPDFMLDQQRSGQFYCDRTQHNHLLTDRCFDLMKKQLQFNICDLRSSFVFDSEVADLEERVKKNISAGLFYACQYWGEHLLISTFSDALHDKLAEFLSNRLLFWMEVLNIRKCIGTGTSILDQAEKWLLVS
jgi:hypothetical protein